jgi:hypothetical protein
MSTDLPSEPPSASSTAPTPSTARDLAARALLTATGCTQQRISELLETSRRSIGRTAGRDLGTALQNPTVIAEARTVLAHSAACGSTVAERQAAEGWLAQVLDGERSVEAVSRPRAVVRPTKTVQRPARAVEVMSRRRTVIRPTKTPAAPVKPETLRSAPAIAIPEIEALERQQQRILYQRLNHLCARRRAAQRPDVDHGRGAR